MGKERQRIIRWDEERIKKLASLYGLKLQTFLIPAGSGQTCHIRVRPRYGTRRDSYGDPTLVECPPMCPPNSEAGPDVTADTMDGADSYF